MRSNRFVMAFVVGISLAVAAGRAEAKNDKNEKPVRLSFSGTSTNKSDLSFDGNQQGFGFINTMAGKGTLGAFNAQLVAEFLGVGVCGGGTGFDLVVAGEAVVLSFTSSGDQLFLALSPSVTSHACLDVPTGVTDGETTLDVTGGTGRFAGATGTVVKTWKSIHLAPVVPPGNGSFSSFTGTFEGTIGLAD